MLKELESLVKNKYDEEKMREETLISQASNMQSVFAISSAALFMILPVIVDYRGKLKLSIIFVFVSIITGFLILSLIFATLAQWRFKMKVLPNSSSLMEGVRKKVTDILKDKRIFTVHNINQYKLIQEDKAKCNHRRVIFICVSMCTFFLAILFCIIFFVVATIKIFM